MKTTSLLLFVLLAQLGAFAQGDTNGRKPCFTVNASPASEADTAAFKQILEVLHVDLVILLYESHDSKLENYGGAMSFRCPIPNHEIYETFENWTIYDPDLIQGDAARDFVFAHEIAHHLSGDTSSDRPRSKQVELRADFNGTKYLLQLRWNEARLLHALNLLNLPQGPQVGYPTFEERKATVENAVTPPRPSPPTNLRGTIVSGQPPSYDELFESLLQLNYQGPLHLQSVRTKEYVCAIGTPDPKIPSTRRFSFFDSCEEGGAQGSVHSGTSGQLRILVYAGRISVP